MVIRNTSHTILCLILLCYYILNPSEASDTISGNQTLSGDQTLVSSGGKFVIGFFTPGNSSKHYIGIWHNKVVKQTVVWVANRATPVSDKYSAKLMIQDGNLVLLNESSFKIWSTEVNPTSENVIAVLLDSGNLILRDGSGSNLSLSGGLWESFDSPTDTWLPGGRIGFSKVTKKNQILTSWRNSEDPAPGMFSLEVDPNGRQFIMRWNRSEQYWTSGPWNGHMFSLIPEMISNYIYNFSYVDSDEARYFTYSLYNASRVLRFFMDASGQMRHYSWSDDRKEWTMFGSQPRKQCDIYDYCGAYGICNQNSLPFCACLPGFKRKSDDEWNLKDYSGGCVREMDLQFKSNCSVSSEKIRFWVNPFVKVPDHSQSLAVGSVGECKSACLSNCSCAAYAYEGNECFVWNSQLLSLQQLPEGDGSGKTIYVKLAASSSVFSGRNSHKKVVVEATLGSVTFVLVFMSVILAFLLKRRKGMVGTFNTGDGTLMAFAYRDLQNATKNFSNKLGGGGFGSVFKGTLPDSSVVAVKKLESINQGEKQFRSEVSTIGAIQHVNLVRLRGFCSEGNKKLLVYDYMEKGSLDSHLFKANKSNVLKWETRSQIALGIARGLVYLHERCIDCIIHCDIKPENILLDSEYCPKVADFGLAKLVGRDFSRVLTTMRGTRGYLAPEWLSGVAITAKSDVYSYGMVLFELVSGKRNSIYSEDGTAMFFPSVAASVTIEGGDILDLLDPFLDRNADVNEVVKICKLACWCIQDDEKIRPSMSEVVRILEGTSDVKMPPMPHWLQMLYVKSQEHIIFFTDSSGTGQSSQTISDTTKASPQSETAALNKSSNFSASSDS